MSSCWRRSVRSRRSASAVRRSPAWETVRSYSGPNRSWSLRLRRWRPAKNASRASRTITTRMATSRPVSMGCPFPGVPVGYPVQARMQTCEPATGNPSGPPPGGFRSGGGRSQRWGRLGVVAAELDQAPGGLGDLGRVVRIRRPPRAELVVVVAGQHVDVQVEHGLVADRAVGVGLDQVDAAGPEGADNPAG